MQRFGEKLRALRKQRGMTLVELARELGYVNNGYLSLIENGKIKPRVEFVVKVANLFQVSTDQLVRDEVEIDMDDAASGDTADPVFLDTNVLVYASVDTSPFYPAAQTALTNLNQAHVQLISILPLI